MGYTHYTTKTRAFTAEEWSQVMEASSAFLRYVQHVKGVPLAKEFDEPGTQPVVSQTEIVFNGLGDGGCETFVLTPGKPARLFPGASLGYEWTKTNREDYDLVVKMILAFVSTCLDNTPVIVTSDGTPTEWFRILKDARKAFPRCANQIDVPMPVMQAAVWRTGESARFNESDYRVGMAVDGHFYVKPKKGPGVCRLDDRTHYDRICAGLKERYDWHVSPQGWIDDTRRAKIKRAQNMHLRKMVTTAESFGRCHYPPAYVRPFLMPGQGEEAIGLENIFDLLNPAQLAA